MRFLLSMTTGVLIVSTALSLQAQTAAPAGEVHTENKGIPPRVAPSDYQTQAKAGTVTIAAEFTGHAFPTSEGPLNNADFIAVEVALYGADGGRLNLLSSNFSLRVNGKKDLLPAQPYGMTLSSLKDPEWIPPEPPEKKSKGSVGAGGQGGADGNLPALPPKIPIPVQRAMAQRLQRVTLPEGDRALPQAGLLFFRYRGKTENVQSVELLYEGPAGQATLKLQ